MVFHTLSNFDIENYMKHFKHFRGVFMNDELPNAIENHESGIVNYENSNQGGSHWIAYDNHPDSKYVYYFCSYGLPPTIQLEKYLKSSGKLILFNDTQLQPYGSNLCGYYCIMFIHFIESHHDGRPMSYLDFMSQFKANKFENDQLIKSLTLKMFHVQKSI